MNTMLLIYISNITHKGEVRYSEVMRPGIKFKQKQALSSHYH